jgi:ABC-type spermidine/putrescine transport system permease subunit I
LEISGTAAVVSVLLAYPVALHVMRQKHIWRAVFLTLILVPFWTSILVKSYAFIVVLGDRGVINGILRGWFGLDGLSMMFNRFAVIVGMTNFLVPFAIFPILSSLSAQNQTIQAAADVMGASPLRIFWAITFPQSLPGVFAALLMCLVISMGFFVTPALLGGRQDMMMANIIDLYTREILDWQSASLIALLLLIFCGGTSGAILKLQQQVGR